MSVLAKSWWAGRRGASLVLAAVACAVLGAGCGGAAAVGTGTLAQPSAGPSVTPNASLPMGRAVVPGSVVGMACVTSGPEQCFNARDDNCNGLIDEGCGVPTGPVQFMIAWDVADADVDLSVTDPKGETADVGHPTTSGLVKERDCPGAGAPCQGHNYENVYLDEPRAPRGRYRVQVRVERLGDKRPPLKVLLGARLGGKSYQVELAFQKAEQTSDLTFEL